MRVLDEIAGKVESVVGEKAPTSALLAQLVEYLHRPETGGLRGLVDKFEGAGLGMKIQSWLGAGQKLPITPDEITRVLGTSEIAHMAEKTGLTPADTSKHLAELLPDAVSHLTPEGKIPGSSMFGELVGSLKDKVDK